MTELFGGGLPAQRKPIRPLWLEDFHDDSDGVPRVPDWRLAEVLDYGRGTNVHNLIERNRHTLEHFGNLLHREVNYPGPGRPGSEYLLNFNQAIFIVIKSEAPNAIPVQIHVVEIYGLWVAGKLRPVDAETETAVDDATAKMANATPDLFALLFEQIAMLATRDQIGGVGDRVSSVQRTALEIQERLGDFVKRRAAPVRNQDIYDQVVIDFYLGRCPCCQRSDRVIIRDGHHTKFYHLDHATDNAYKNGLHEMWPVCGLCNGKLRAEPHYRIEKMDNFRVFQNNVQEHIGRRLI
jgi:hypothetical protein